MIERTDNVKTALTQLAQQASSSGKAIKSLTWRMNSGAGFLPMALLKAEPGATVRVEMMEGGWSSGDGSAETREAASDDNEVELSKDRFRPCSHFQGFSGLML